MNRRSLLVVSTHSFVDLITNSSTELFVCDSKKTVDAIKELLATLLKNHDAIEGEEHSFGGCFGTIEATPYCFDWWKVAAPVQDSYKYYNRYCSYGHNPYAVRVFSSSDRNPEEQDLEEQARYISIRHNADEKGLYERDKDEYERRHAAARKEIDALWTDYGCRSLAAHKDLFVEFLKQNEFAPELIEEAVLTFEDSIEEHRREKRGQHSWFRRDFKSEALNKAYEVFQEWSGWGIEANKGDVFIYSSSDNSIPYLLFGTIESYLNADRYHLG